MEIKRSDVEKWVLADSKYACAAYADDWFEWAKNPHATVFGELSPAVQSVLKNAPSGGVQLYGPRGWVAGTTWDFNTSSAYRLHPDCVLVDESKWVEPDVQLEDNDYRVLHDGFLLPLTFLPTRIDCVCIKAIDEAGNVFYVKTWSPYETTLFASIEDVVSSEPTRSGSRVLIREGKLTPIAVVFERRE